MPLYEYIAEDPEGGCRTCSKGFELRRPVDRLPLGECPLCRAPVRKLVSTISSPKLSKPLSVSSAKSAGFTVLEKRDKGTYEKL